MSLHEGMAWIRILDAPGYERAARAERSPHYKVQDGRNCTAVCTKKNGLIMPRAIGTHCRTIGAKVSSGPVKVVLALVTEPRAKREARSVLCHTCQ